jgi:hypothetical protein
MMLFRKAKTDAPVTIVSGLPRSGTSMMMRMLEAGGMTPLMDGERTADTDNPKGYYELERVKRLPQGDYGWLEEARGKVVKIISALLIQLPASYRYRVIFMRRALPEILASQRKMLTHREEDPDRLSDEQLTDMYDRHLESTFSWMTERPNVEYIETSFNDMLGDPAPTVQRLLQFLGEPLDRARMESVVDPKLYRQRKSS